MKKYDVIISGAGPVGLFLACELALAKCSVLILERAENQYSPLKKIPFGMRGLSTPTIETLYRRGMLDELQIHKRIKNPHTTTVPSGPGRQVGHFAGIPFHEGNVDHSQWTFRLPGSPETSLLSEMEELETIFIHRAELLGVKIKRGLAVSDFHEEEMGVIVYAGDQSFQCRWLIGCDGSRSVIRKKAGFEFAGTEPEFTGYTAQVDIADPEKLKSGRNMTSNGMYLQSQPGYIIIQDFDGGVFHNSERPVTKEHFQEVLRRVSNTDVTITALHVSTTWTDRARQATSYRNGRIILAGDAAHIHAPLGGQGLNLGFGDAMNLGWKLAATIKHNAPEKLLDSYFTERHPIGAQVLDWSRAQALIMNPNESARAMNSIMRDLLNTRDGATYIAGRIWGIHLHYDLGDKHPLVGYSVPNFEFNDGSKIGELMRDGLGIFIDFENNLLFRNIIEDYSDNIKYISGSVKNQLGLSAALIRPDGIVAWVADKNSDTSDLKSVVDLSFTKSKP